jgi:hypothetical protein
MDDETEKEAIQREEKISEVIIKSALKRNLLSISSVEPESKIDEYLLQSRKRLATLRQSYSEEKEANEEMIEEKKTEETARHEKEATKRKTSEKRNFGELSPEWFQEFSDSECELILDSGESASFSEDYK